ncbi:MAG: glycosyl hydrolase, partial [Spirochaetaceae bacterium]|nr:glycosyl hydrolase [Spirochaetaceae bacterium]
MKNAQDIVKLLTLEEKASLCSGLDVWHTEPVERLGLEPIMMCDGPHGLRKQPERDKTVPAVCFPPAVTTASSWDRHLAAEIGAAIGDTCLAEGVSIILGPGANIKRSPLCGRNFEYFSEDPYAAGEMAGNYIKGVQSKGVGTSLKHFCLNNQETRRNTEDAIVDERAMREIYLTGFEKAVKIGRPWTLMCSYNLINGAYGSENHKTLTEILREEWGFKGLVMSDWGAVNDRPLGVKAGLDLEMPGPSPANDKRIVKAVQEGKLSIEALDKVVTRVVELILKSMHNKKHH